MAAEELRTPEDVRRHFQELNPRRPEDDPVLRRWHIAKRITWMLLLAGSFLFYYLISKLLEAVSMLR